MTVFAWPRLCWGQANIKLSSGACPAEETEAGSVLSVAKNAFKSLFFATDTSDPACGGSTVNKEFDICILKFDI
jgi:hypothetical protein